MNDLEKLCRNAVDVIDKDDLAARLKEGKPLRVKAGFDPSAPDIHLGHTVLLRKLREFQDAGHKVIFIVGDFTAMIGDPTGRSKTRPVLSREQVDANARTYQEQAFKILDNDPKKIEVVRNSTWLDKPEMLPTLFKIGSQVTVDQLLVREDFDKRRKAHQPVALQELFYPLLQGYDSVVVKADIEIGGTDQLFNLLMGREIQKQYKMRQQVVMTLPLLVGLDGTQKMSKSYGNYIGVTDSAKDIYGKIMSIPDTLMETYIRLLTNCDDVQSAVHKAVIDLNPRNAKSQLGEIIVDQFFGSGAGKKEAEEFSRIFSRKENPENPEELHIPESEIWIVDLLKRAGAATSTSEARRLIEQGAVSVDGDKVSDFNARISNKSSIVKIGKKKFLKIISLR